MSWDLAEKIREETMSDTQKATLRQSLVDPYCAVNETGKPVFMLTREWEVDLSAAGEYLRFVVRAVNSHDKLLEALKAIRDGEPNCECDHTTDDCCNKAGVYCPFCMAEAAIQSAEEEPNARNQSE